MPKFTVGQSGNPSGRKRGIPNKLTHEARRILEESVPEVLQATVQSAILDDLLDPSIGQSVFARFTASKAETLWYYSELARIFSERRSPVSQRLNGTIREIQNLAGQKRQRLHKSLPKCCAT